MLRARKVDRLILIGYFGHCEKVINALFEQGCVTITESGIWGQVVYE